MNRRVVIADAGPLIALAGTEALDLLRQLFGRVFITTTVCNEILPVRAAFADADLLLTGKRLIRRLDQCGRSADF